jgi:hypothetical protein
MYAGRIKLLVKATKCKIKIDYRGTIEQFSKQ